MMAGFTLAQAGLLSILLVTCVSGVGYRTVASSGVAAQMVFLVPNTNKLVFIDKYHPNHGYPTVNLKTGAPNRTSWLYPGTQTSVFGAEFDWTTYHLRMLHPNDDTSCSIGAYFPDGTLVNVAGAPAGGTGTGVGEGFDNVRTYAPGPCGVNDVCKQDWVERGKLSTYRWYPSASAMVDGNVLVVGGAKVGGLVLNEASINVPSYEIVRQNNTTPTKPVTLPILEFTSAQNLVAGFSYNMYPLLYLLPNSRNANEMFTLAGNRSVIWDYGANKLVKTLPDIPLQARTFPSSATSVLLPMNGALPETPTILVCGGASGNIPNPLSLNDCWYISPYATNPTWQRSDNLPNGPQVMSNGIMLPDGSTLMLNGARIGCGGEHMAENPVFEPIIYRHRAPAGSRFTTQPSTTIPRLYHSVAILLPTGEVLVAGSNPPVTYSAVGKDGPGWPEFQNNGHTCALHRQQAQSSRYPTEYRVEIFSPPYMDQTRPVITVFPPVINHNSTFSMSATLNGAAITSTAQAVLLHQGFQTHGQGQGQRMLNMATQSGTGNSFTVTTPLNPSVMPSGQYLLWMVVNGIPSQAEWISLQS